MSLPDSESALDDLIQITAPLTLPIKVRDLPNASGYVARGIEVIGGGNLTLRMPSGAEREYTQIQDPWSVDLKFTEIVAATTATKIRVGF